MAAFPELDLRCSTVPSDKNLFVVRYVGSGGRPSLSVHKDQVPLTVNIALSAHCNYSGGGTYFPTRGGDCNGIVLRPHAGTAIMHDGNVEHRPRVGRLGDDEERAQRAEGRKERGRGGEVGREGQKGVTLQ